MNMTNELKAIPGVLGMLLTGKLTKAGFLIFAIIASPIRDEVEEKKKQMYKDRLK